MEHVFLPFNNLLMVSIATNKGSKHNPGSEPAVTLLLVDGNVRRFYHQDQPSALNLLYQEQPQTKPNVQKDFSISAVQSHRDSSLTLKHLCFVQDPVAVLLS